MIFKKLHKKFEDENNSETKDEVVKVQSSYINVEESLESLEKRLQKTIRLQERRRKTKRVCLTILLVIGLLGGFKALFSNQKEVSSAVAVNDYAFAEEYIETYFKYPKAEEDNTYLKSFTTENWTNEYDNSQVKSAFAQSIDIYQVKQGEKGLLKIYATFDLALTNMSGAEEIKKVNVEVDVINNKGTYVVNAPISMIYSNVSPMDEELKKEYIKNNKDITGTDCTESEKQELTNTIKLFLSTYNTDFTQAQLLMQNSNDLMPLDLNTKIEFESIGTAKKDKDTYTISSSVLIKTHGVLTQRRNLKFVFDISSNKIMEMEEY